MSRDKQYTKIFAVTLIGLTLALMGSELLLRIMQFDLFVHQGTLLSEGDNKDFADRAIPTNHNRRNEIEWYFDLDFKRIKETPPKIIKLHQKELTLSKSKKRVFCMGDSGTFGSGVSQDQTFCSRLQKKYPEWEFFNFGIPGKDLLCSYNELQALLDYKPDHVILGYFLSNDLNQTYARWVVDHNEDQYWNSISKVKKSSFKLINLFNVIKFYLKFKLHQPELERAGQNMITTPEGLNLNDYIEGEFAFYLPDNPITEKVYDFHSTLLEKFKRLSREHSFSFQVLLIPTRSYLTKSYIQLPDNPAGLEYFEKKNLNFSQDQLNFDKPIQNLIRICQKLEILCHNPSSSNPSPSILLENDDHLSSEGHKRSADLIQFTSSEE